MPLTAYLITYKLDPKSDLMWDLREDFFETFFIANHYMWGCGVGKLMSSYYAIFFVVFFLIGLLFTILWIKSGKTKWLLMMLLISLTTSPVFVKILHPEFSIFYWTDKGYSY